MTGIFCTQAIHQQSSSETEEGGNTADGSSEGEEGDSVEEEDNKEKLKGDKTGSKRKKTATSKVLQLVSMSIISISCWEKYLVTVLWRYQKWKPLCDLVPAGECVRIVIITFILRSRTYRLVTHTVM